MMLKLSVSIRLCLYCRKIKLLLMHLNAGQSLSLMHSDLANTTLLGMQFYRHSLLH